MIRFILILLAVAFLPLTALANVTAASASAADVIDAFGDIISGQAETLFVPSGSAAWDNINFSSKTFILRGAGRGVTVISNVDADGIGRLSGRTVVRDFTFSGTVGSTSDDLWNADGQDWVFFQCHFWNTANTVLAIRYQDDSAPPRGLVRKCWFTDSRNYIASPYFNGFHAAFAAPTDLGSTNQVYYEENKFTNTVSALNVFDLLYGSKAVLRSNQFHNCFPATHGVQDDDRGPRQHETYANLFTGGTQPATMGIGGGVGIFWNNTNSGPTGDSARIWLELKRSYDSFGTGTRADGHSNWDGNLTNGIAGAVGTHTGANNASTLTDSTKSAIWVNDVFLSASPPTYNRWIYNLTDGSSGQITDNTTTTVTVTLSGGTDNDWDTGDSYKITGGYPARDQIGAGQDASEWTTAFTGAAPVQAIEGFWIWGNVGFSSPIYLLNDQGSAQTAFLLEEGRDIMLEQHPTYVPLGQHPLAPDGAVAGTITFGGGTINQGGGTITFQ